MAYGTSSPSQIHSGSSSPKTYDPNDSQAFRDYMNRMAGKSTGPGTYSRDNPNPHDPNNDPAFRQRMEDASRLSRPYDASSEYTDRYSGMAEGVQGRAAPTMQFDQGLRQSLMDAAMGNTPSVAEMQLGTGLDKILAAQMSARASQRGGRVGATNRLVSQGANEARMGTQAQASQMRAQEMARAQGLMAGVETNIGQANLGAQMQSQQMIDQMTQYYVSLGHNVDEANRRALMEYDQMLRSLKMADDQRKQQEEAAWMGAGGTMIETVMGNAEDASKMFFPGGGGGAGA